MARPGKTTGDDLLECGGGAREELEPAPSGRARAGAGAREEHLDRRSLVDEAWVQRRSACLPAWAGCTWPEP